ncbi:MAG: S53 family peptidase [Oryzihumus sp.]
MAFRYRRGVVLGSTTCLTLALATPGLAHADTSRHTVEAAPSWTAHARPVGQTPSTARQTFTAVLGLRDEAGAEALAGAVSDPSSAQYGQYLSAAEWRSRFAPTQASVDTVTGWLRSNGFAVTDVPANHRFVSFTGTTAQAEQAFATDLKEYDKQGSTVSANATSASVPAALSGLVVGIGGLDASARRTPDHAGGPEATRRHTAARATAAQPGDVLPPPDPVFHNAGPCSGYYGEKPATDVPQILADPLTYAPCGYTPTQLRGAYGVDGALKQGYDGRGATVAVVDAYASPYILGDAQTYAKRHDPSHPLRGYQLSQSTPASYSYVDECGASGWYGEETLDVEAVHATAPQADILYVGASSCQNSDLNAAVNTVVDNSLAQVVTNSYGSAGEPTSRADVAEEHQTFLQAAAQGISMLFSSGDSGDEVANTGSRQVDYEASDPFVTAVGGTALAVTRTNGYGFEQGWGTGKSTLTNGSWVPNPPAYLYGGGGGTSHLFKQPGYQKGVVPESIANYFGEGPHRAVPDVAMLGDPNTGMLVGQSQTFPDGSVKYDEYRIGGTSLASPLFAGLVAVGDQVKGGSLGFLNPTLYRLAGTSAFRDVNHGQAVTDGVVRVDYVNGFDGADGTRTSLRTLNQTGTIYTRKGYDDVTGVGSPNGVNFLAAVAAQGSHRQHDGAGTH